MKNSHIHLSFLDLNSAIQWMKSVLDKDPGYQNEGMATFSFENIEYVFDRGDFDVNVTIALASTNCEADFKTFIQKGAVAVEMPATQPWGVKTAYIKGPGRVVFEIEESLNQGK